MTGKTVTCIIGGVLWYSPVDGRLHFARVNTTPPQQQWYAASRS